MMQKKMHKENYAKTTKNDLRAQSKVLPQAQNVLMHRDFYHVHIKKIPIKENIGIIQNIIFFLSLFLQRS